MNIIVVHSLMIESNSLASGPPALELPGLFLLGTWGLCGIVTILLLLLLLEDTSGQHDLIHVNTRDSHWHTCTVLCH